MRYRGVRVGEVVFCAKEGRIKVLYSSPHLVFCTCVSARYDLLIPNPRATIKAHPATPHRPRPYEKLEGNKQLICNRMVYND